jgi:hypothetical protein
MAALALPFVLPLGAPTNIREVFEKPLGHKDQWLGSMHS